MPTPTPTRKLTPERGTRPLRVLFAIDKFKGCLTSRQVAEALLAGLRSTGLAIESTILPVADGGDGLIAAFQEIDADYQTLTRLVTGPRGGTVSAQFLRHARRPEWILEMAQASGLALLPQPRRNPLETSTRGTGELLAHAVQSGAKKILLGIGGSATNDGGAGAATALGFRFLDRLDCPIDPTGGNLQTIAKIDATHALPELSEIKIVVACDVDNPLTGPRGAAQIYGPQKGADAAMIATLDAGLAHLAHLIERDLGPKVADISGGGAAGGLGAGAIAFFNASLQPGAQLILDAVQFDTRAGFADLIVTGEGRLDSQTAAGKTPWVVAQRAAFLQKPVVAVAGKIEPTFRQLLSDPTCPIEQAWAIRDLAKDDTDSLTHATQYLHQLGARLAQEFPALARPTHRPNL